MAIVVLVLWMFTAGAGFYLLVTSNLGRARPASRLSAAEPAGPAGPAEPAGPAGPAGPAEPAPATVTTPATPLENGASAFSSTPAVPTASTAQAATAAPASKRELRRAARDRFDPPSLTAAKNAPAVPGLRSLLEFAHPAAAALGLGFWLAYTLVHDRALGWIGFGLVAATVCLGLTWFAANTRTARGRTRPGTQGAPDDDPPPSFSARLAVLHGGAAAVTLTLAALTVFVLGR